MTENAKQNKILCFQIRKKLASETKNSAFAFFIANSDLVNFILMKRYQKSVMKNET